MAHAPTTFGMLINANAITQLATDCPPIASSNTPTANVPADAVAKPSVEYTAIAVPRLAAGATCRIPDVSAAESALMSAL